MLAVTGLEFLAYVVGGLLILGGIGFVMFLLFFRKVFKNVNEQLTTMNEPAFRDNFFKDFN